MAITMSDRAFINRIGCALPPHDIHRKFVAFAPRLLPSERERALYARMVERSQIEHRYSCLAPSPDPAEIDAAGFYRRGRFPDTKERMARYEREAVPLACRAVAELGLGPERRAISHLIVASCTGFTAPGLDLGLIAELDLDPSVERTIVGFMGCSAALPALKLARHIVRSNSAARVLVVALELCTLHLQETSQLDELLSFSLFGDGCAAALVTAEPCGIEIEGFAARVLPGTPDYLTWRIGASGFEMCLSGQVPLAILKHLPIALPALLAPRSPEETRLWAIHPGGRSILDAVEESLDLPPGSLVSSRRILRDCGNISSASVLFVLADMLGRGESGRGCAIAFGPGLSIEAMRFGIGR